MRGPARALLLILAAAVVCAARQMDDSDAKSKIMALEQLFKQQAYQARDTKILDALLDERFVSADPDGTLQTKAELGR